MQITKVDGSDLAVLVTIMKGHKDIRDIRFSQGPEGLKIKINSGMWSAPFGTNEQLTAARPSATVAP